MKHLVVTVALVALSFFSGCGSNGSSGGGDADQTSTRIVGTVIDASTGEPVANVKVEGPHERSTRSDARGRFEFKGLEIGTEGEVTAATDDGRKARIALRRLAPGRLEIVLQLTAR